jgi:hypothetical protein
MAAPEPSPTSSVVAALAVYAEALIAGARVLLVGAGHDLEPSLSELGARSVHVYDLDRGDPQVREGAFDLAIVPDVGLLQDPAGVVRRLRRVVDARGSVLALGRASTEHADAAALPEVAPAALGYPELYDLFALQFENVAMTGVLPFAGIVFAELGQADDVAVSVDTRLADPGVPGVFVVVASREPADLDPYAIVQVTPEAPPVTRDRESEATLAAAQLKANFLAAQLDDLRAERDEAAARAEQIEGLFNASQHALAVLEQRLGAAEQRILERDDLLAAVRGEIDALRSVGTDLVTPDPELVAELVARTERAETALALNVADLAHVAEAHAGETAALEAQLRERARVIASMEKELARREQLVRELVASLDEARELGGAAFAPPPAPTSSFDVEELGRLRRKLDELALEIARREGELVAQAWRIEELEAKQPAGEVRSPTEDASKDSAKDLERELGRVRDELDALRQALTQEHAARVAAESGEELTRARAELARQAALLEQIRGAGSQPGG